MTSSKHKLATPRAPKELGDFTTTRRVLPIMALAVAIGLLSSWVALALLRMIGLFTNLFFYQRWSTALVSPAGNHLGGYQILVPVAGALIIGFMARYGSERIRGHGIPEAIESILLKGSRIEARVAILKPISSAISIGSGGPFGAEGPIIMTGGAFGSLVAQLFRLTSAERKTLLVAGAAAGMSATFGSPVAAALLAVELLLFEWKPRSFIPVALASATAAIVRPYLLGAGPLFAVPPHSASFGPTAVFACIACGLLAGGLSALLTLSVYTFEDLFQKLPIHWMWWPAIGGVVVGVGGLIYPHALGVGYDTIESLLRGDLVGPGLLLLIVVKWTIWSVSLGSGTSGGVLAPLLIMGAALGGIEAIWFPNQGVGFWQVVSMGAILGGTMRSPFTGIIFVLELTHDVNLLLPLLTAVTCAHAVTVLVLKRSILTEKVSRRGFHLTREYATDPLEILFVREIMGSEVAAIPAAMLREELSAALAGRHRGQSLFAVVGGGGELVGVVTRWVLERWAEGPADAAAPSLASIAHKPVTAYPDEPLHTIMNRMAATGLTSLPVVDRANPRRLVGNITLRDMLKARVRHLEEEQRREGAIPLNLTPPAWLRLSPKMPSSPKPSAEPVDGRGSGDR
ncbi:MAG TPA: chloride channel protein [Polyangiaceae bacterium]|nr:chloride channel protein [Polyangiaceae bacterium]